MAHTYLITGANRGLGLEFAEQINARGDAVIGTARDPEGADDLRSAGARVEALDVGDEASILALAERLSGEAIDVLICNAGMHSGEHKFLRKFDAEHLVESYRVNALAPLLLARAFLPHLGRGQRKLIVNISSQMGSLGQAFEGGAAGGYAYRGSKAALNMHTLILANELRDDGITCLSLHPGWVRTRMGGEEADLGPQESIGGMLRIIDSAGPEVSGRFLDWRGETRDW
jgi:NAD(P)-dependent dehydrogenase (short-subunit alcohol dehydrogenase family)